MVRSGSLAVCLVTLAATLGAAGETPSKSDSAELQKFGLSDTDWPWWRGPSRDGHAPVNSSVPLEWTAETVLWKVEVPGRGHGSPTVVGDQVFLATADEDEQVQSVLCYERATGALRWRADVHRGNFVKGGNKKASHASSTVACDGERLFINFLNGGAVHTTALSRDGKILWQTKITDYVLHQGYGSSPAVYGPLVLVSADNKGGGALVGMNRATGEIAWKVDRPKLPNYASPIVLRAAGRDQLVLTGCSLVTSLDPLTGEKLWEMKGATEECVTSTVTDGERIFTSGGYPRNHVAAVVADGAKQVAWENPTRVYVPSMLMRNGHLFAVTDAGVATCWNSKTGEEIWKHRLGGTFSSSPVLIGDKILVMNETGAAYVFAADPEKFTLFAENQLGDEVFASPVVCGGRIYLRVAEQIDGRRQEVLYCLGSPRSSGL